MDTTPPEENKKMRAEDLYNDFLKMMEQIVGAGETYTSQLETAGRDLFGSQKFVGVYARDTLPHTFKPDTYAIANLDRSNQEGSHWVAVVGLHNGKKMTYDSFGREMGEWVHNAVATEKDKEQRPKEQNCGARCLAFLCVFYSLGEEFAKYV
jgi:hypothetical protein